MSNEIKAVCGVYTKSMNLAFEPAMGRECGLQLEEVEIKDRRLEELVATAQRTGISTILSKTDAVEKAVEEAVFQEKLNFYTSECVTASGNLELSLRCTKGQEFRSREAAKRDVQRRGVADILARLSPNERTAIQKEADRFLKEAKALIAKRRAGK